MRDIRKPRRIIVATISLLIIAFIVVFLITKGGSNPIPEPNQTNLVILKNYKVLHDEKFGGIYIDISIEDFNKLGFAFGDSVNVKLSNKVEINDIPYYNGYYADIGEKQMVGYPGYSYVKVCVNNGEDLWTKYNVDDKITATVTINQKAKYLNIQEARNLKYTDIQGDIPDATFANFRNVLVGKIKENILYRSATPNDNQHNRAIVVDKLIKEAKVNYIINLADTPEEIDEQIKKEDFNSPYFLSLYNDKKVIALSMNMQFKTEEFNQKLIKGLKAISENNGPYLVHCVEGKDRTGYFIMILEGLMGATYQELIDDYMITYDNYYGVNKETDLEKYNIIKEKLMDVMLKYVADTDDIENVNYEEATEKYLISIGLDKETITKIKDKLK